MTKVSINKKEYINNKGIFALLEFLISEKKSNKIKNALFLGGLDVHYKSIIKKFGFKIDEISEKK